MTHLTKAQLEKVWVELWHHSPDTVIEFSQSFGSGLGTNEYASIMVNGKEVKKIDLTDYSTW